MLAEVASADGDYVSLAEVLDRVGERSFGALLVVFAIPNMAAGVVPGLSTVLSIPLILLSVQLLLAFRKPWLPGRLRAARVRRTDLARMLGRIRPFLVRLERALKPRLSFLTTSWAERVAGLVSVCMSTLLWLPIPFGNLLPAATIGLVGFALLERDGVVAMAALVLAAACGMLFGSVAFAVLTAAMHAFGW
jgi:hypothetical protein